MFFHEVIHATSSTPSLLRRRPSRYRMMFPNDPTRAHVLDRRIDVNHKVLTSLGINKLFGFAKHLLVRPRGRAHGLGPSLNSSGRVLRAGKAALAHPKGLVLDVDAKIATGLGVALTRRVDPPFSQGAFRGRSLAARRCRVPGLGPPAHTNPKPARRDVDPVFITCWCFFIWSGKIGRGRRRRRRLVLAGRARRPLVVWFARGAAHGAVPSLGGCLLPVV